MSETADRFYAAAEATDQGIRRMTTALRETGVDMAENSIALRLRRISEDLGEIEQEFEELEEGGA